MRFYRSVKPQGSIQAFDPLCEVQSDKASVEITSPFDGIIKELLVQEGQVAKVGEGLCLIEVDEETAQSPAEPATSPAEKPIESSLSYDIKDELSESQEPTSKRRLHPLDPNYAPDPMSTTSSDVLATPSVRHFSRQRGVDLGKLAPGSGKGGRIEKRDVEAYLAKGAADSVGGEETRIQDEKDVVVELGRTRYGMWKAMVKVYRYPSMSTIPF